MTDKEVTDLLGRTFKGDCTALVRQLAKQLIVERQCAKAICEALVRQRLRVIDMERGTNRKRVLIVDAPPANEHEGGELVIYQDPEIDVLVVQTKEPWSSEKFFDSFYDDTPMSERFRRMPGELSARYETAWTRKPRT